MTIISCLLTPLPHKLQDYESIRFKKLQREIRYLEIYRIVKLCFREKR